MRNFIKRLGSIVILAMLIATPVWGSTVKDVLYSFGSKVVPIGTIEGDDPNKIFDVYTEVRSLAKHLGASMDYKNGVITLRRDLKCIFHMHSTAVEISPSLGLMATYYTCEHYSEFKDKFKDKPYLATERKPIDNVLVTSLDVKVVNGRTYVDLFNVCHTLQCEVGYDDLETSKGMAKVIGDLSSKVLLKEEYDLLNKILVDITENGFCECEGVCNNGKLNFETMFNVGCDDSSTVSLTHALICLGLEEESSKIATVLPKNKLLANTKQAKERLNEEAEKVRAIYDGFSMSMDVIVNSLNACFDSIIKQCSLDDTAYYSDKTNIYNAIDAYNSFVDIVKGFITSEEKEMFMINKENLKDGLLESWH